MTDSATEELSNFLEYIWGTDAPVEGKQAFCYVPTMEPLTGQWQKVMYKWPEQKPAVIRHILQETISKNVFYSPALYKATRPIKENVLGTYFLWVDFDGNAPLDWAPITNVPEPSLIIQSSLPRHEHCYWQLDHFLMNIDVLEDRNRALAYVLNADTSGWDADQILRPIHTTNHKRGLPVHVKGT